MRAELSLDAGKAQPPFGTGRAGGRAMAVTAAAAAWAVTSGTAQVARVNFQPLPPPVVTLSHAQIARIRG